MAQTARSTEEMLNSLSHGLGALLSAVGLPLLLMQAAKSDNPWHMVACAIIALGGALRPRCKCKWHAHA